MGWQGYFARNVSSELRCPTKSVLGYFVTNIFHFRKEKNFLANRAIKLLNIEPNENVLEIGYGRGDGLLSASDRVQDGTGRIFGVDRSPYLLERAKKHCSLEINQNKIDVHRSFITHLPFPSNFFDKVYHCNEYYFWDDKTLAAAEIFRTMKPGGLMICTLKLDSVRKLVSKRFIPVYPDPLDFMDILEFVGFDEINFDYHDENHSDYFKYQSISCVKPLETEEMFSDEKIEDEEYELTREFVLRERLITMKKTNEPLPMKDKRLKEDDI